MLGECFVALGKMKRKDSVSDGMSVELWEDVVVKEWSWSPLVLEGLVVLLKARYEQPKPNHSNYLLIGCLCQTPSFEIEANRGCLQTPRGRPPLPRPSTAPCRTQYLVWADGVEISITRACVEKVLGSGGSTARRAGCEGESGQDWKSAYHDQG